MPQHCYPALATVTLFAAPAGAGSEGDESRGCPPALVGTSGYSWAAAATAVAVVTMTQLPAFLLPHGHAGTGTHTVLWVGVRVGAAPAPAPLPCPRSPPTFNGAAAH